MVYNNCGGERYAHFIQNVGATVFRDIPKPELLEFNNHLLNYSGEASLEKLAEAGLSPDYVFRETRRALDGAAGSAGSCQDWTSGFPPARTAARPPRKTLTPRPPLPCAHVLMA